jgi:integrase
VISVPRDYFSWAVRERGLSANPALPIFRPRKRDVSRGTFTEGDVRKLLAAQPRLGDRVALLLLFRLGLRKSELARVQFTHYDGRNLTFFGKGGKCVTCRSSRESSGKRSSGTFSTVSPRRTSSCSIRRSWARSSTADP